MTEDDKKNNIEKFADKQTIYNRELTEENKVELSKLNEEAIALAEQIDEIDLDKSDELEAELIREELIKDKEDLALENDNKQEPVVADEKEVIIKKENNTVEKEQLPKKKKKWHIPQPIKYAMCTASAGLIEFITFSILVACMKNVEGTIPFGEQILQVNNFVPTFIAVLLSVLWNFTINRKFTFKSAGNIPRAMFLAFLFYVPFFPFKLWFNGTMPAHLVGVMGDGAAFFIEVCSMLINGILEFCWQKFVIYRNEENTAVPKENK